MRKILLFIWGLIPSGAQVWILELLGPGLAQDDEVSDEDEAGIH